MDVNALVQNAAVTLVAVAWKVAGAAALWLIGRSLIGFALRLMGRAFAKQRFDVTLARYIHTALSILLNVALAVAVLSFFGVETTTFAALLAAGGVAIGVAWGGLLANFAAGAFLVFLRPFKVGDAVTAGGVTGTVDAIGLFGTVINTADNVHAIVGNSRVFSDTVQNYSVNPYRRVDLTATISDAVNHRHGDPSAQAAARRGAQRAADRQAPDVDVLQVHAGRPAAVRAPSSRNAHYWQVSSTPTA